MNALQLDRGNILRGRVDFIKSLLNANVPVDSRCMEAIIASMERPFRCFVQAIFLSLVSDPRLDVMPDAARTSTDDRQLILAQGSTLCFLGFPAVFSGMIHSNHIRSEQPSGLVEVSSPTYFQHGVKDASLSMSMLPLRGFHQHSIGALLSPIATPKNPTPSFRVRTDEAVAPKVPSALVIGASSAFKALGLSFFDDASTETKAATSTFDDLLYASVICGSGRETTLASAAEVYVTPSAGSPHGFGSVTASQGVPTTDQKSPVHVRVFTIASPTLKRKRLQEGPKKIVNSPAVIDATPRNCSGKHFPSLAVYLQKATTSERRESMLGRQSTTQCRCKRSRCLKKYCQCFLVNALCNEACACTNCGNNDL
jgi:hypothetical protein